MIYINGVSVFAPEDIDPSISKDIEESPSVTDGDSDQELPLC